MLLIFSSKHLKWSLNQYQSFLKCALLWATLSKLSSHKWKCLIVPVVSVLHRLWCPTRPWADTTLVIFDTDSYFHFWTASFKCPLGPLKLSLVSLHHTEAILASPCCPVFQALQHLACTAPLGLPQNSPFHGNFSFSWLCLALGGIMPSRLTEASWVGG